MSTAQIKQVKSSPLPRGARRTDPGIEPPNELIRTTVQAWPTELAKTGGMTGPKSQTARRRAIEKPVLADEGETLYTVKKNNKTGNRPRPAGADVSSLTDADALYDVHPHTSALRYNYQAPKLHDTNEGPKTETGLFIQRRRLSPISRPGNSGMSSKAITPAHLSLNKVHSSAKHFPIFVLVVGILAALALVASFNLVSSWWQVRQDDMLYGRPRTSQLDAIVGHNDSAQNPTHFIFLNLNRHVEIIEIPGGDGAHAHIYLGPVLFGDNQDLTPITGTIRDVNGDGKPDLIVHIQQQNIVFINDGQTFRTLKPGERVVL